MQFGSIKARVVRVTREDECGIPATGADDTVVSDGFISVEVSPVYEDGEEFFQKNAWGDSCVDEVDDPLFRRADLNINFCGVNPLIYDITAGSRSLVSGSDVVGAVWAGGQISDRFGVETWTKIPGQACSDGQTRWLYWVFPHLGGAKVGAFTLENALATFAIEASTKGAAAEWAEGPGATDYLPATEQIDAGDHWGFSLTLNDPPTADE